MPITAWLTLCYGKSEGFLKKHYATLSVSVRHAGLRIKIRLMFLLISIIWPALFITVQL